MSLSTPLDAALVFGLGGFIFFQLSRSNGSAQYRKQRRLITLGPPAWVFGVVWTLIYAFLTVSAYYAVTSAAGSDVFTALVCVFFVNIMLNKYWSVVFFDHNNYVAALVILLGIIGTSVAYLVLVWPRSATAFWFHLFPYVPWCLAAMVWNIQIIYKTSGGGDGADDNDDDDEETPSSSFRTPIIPMSMRNRIKGKAPPMNIVPPPVGGGGGGGGKRNQVVVNI